MWILVGYCILWPFMFIELLYYTIRWLITGKDLGDPLAFVFSDRVADYIKRSSKE
jgi:hypothetical protein